MQKLLTMWITTNCGKLFKRWEYRPPDLPHETSVCRSKATVRTGHGTMDGFQIGKEYVKAIYCHPAF